jgi:serine/threonine-protein kinase
VNPLKVCPQCATEYPANARFCEIDGTALRSAGDQQDMVGSIVAERYHVMKKLGEGGMGQVYLAEHVKMGRKSALKVMHPGMVKDVDAISRFNREAANASRISHPNVAAVYDFGETTEGVIFLAMEFVDGPPLTKVIDQAGALPATRAAEIVRQTGEALAVAHDLGIVHRDLKPDNIMIGRTRDGGDLVKVVDFGIAKAQGNEAAQKVTKTGLVVGTPDYMSPEQLAGDKLDGRSDVYSLGLVAFNMLTGKLPFPSDSAQESMIMRLTDRPKPLSEMRPEIAWPADVQAVMDKALERDVTLRYQTATEFGRDLYRTIERMPETAAAVVGTQMIDVPPTRVAPPRVSEVSAPAASAAPLPTAVAPAAPVMQTAAPEKKSNKIAIVGGGGLAAAAVIVALVAYLNKTAAGGTSIDSPATQAPETTSAPAVTPGQSGTPTPPIATSQVPVSAPVSAPPATNSGATKALVDQLRDLITDSKNATMGASVLTKLAPLERQAGTSAERYLSAVVRSNVLATRATGRDSAAACAEWTRVLPLLGPEETEQAQDRISSLSCP